MFLCKIILLACACAVVAGLPLDNDNGSGSIHRDDAAVCTMMSSEEAKKARDNWQILGDVEKIVTVNKADKIHLRRGDTFAAQVDQNNIQRVNGKLMANGANPAKIGDVAVCKVVSAKDAQKARNTNIVIKGGNNHVDVFGRSNRDGKKRFIFSVAAYFLGKWLG